MGSNFTLQILRISNFILIPKAGIDSRTNPKGKDWTYFKSKGLANIYSKGRLVWKLTSQLNNFGISTVSHKLTKIVFKCSEFKIRKTIKYSFYFTKWLLLETKLFYLLLNFNVLQQFYNNFTTFSVKSVSINFPWKQQRILK